MQWSAEPHAGFCSLEVEPWLPIAPDYQQVNVAAESEEPGSMLSLTRALIQLRRTTPALSVGSYRPVDEVPAECFVYQREHQGVCRLIALNLSAAEQTVAAPEFGSGSISLSTYLDREGPVDLASLQLRPNEGCIVALAERR